MKRTFNITVRDEKQYQEIVKMFSEVKKLMFDDGIPIPSKAAVIWYIYKQYLEKRGKEKDV
jgi:hypothetical protein|tara:strand:+ start:4122 stop:4304 length:183 start_codon:yes stop_codon:yes gene_type:complete